MPTYCKAFTLGDLRRFSGWETISDPRQQSLANDYICYLHENLTVTESCFDDAASLLAHVTPEWEAFCRGDLQFEVPEDIRAAQATMAATETQADPQPASST